MRLDEKVMKLVLQELVHSKLQYLMHQPGSFSEPVSAEKPEHSLHLHGAAHLSLAQHSLAAWRYLRGRGYHDLSAPESHNLNASPPCRFSGALHLGSLTDLGGCEEHWL